MNLSRTLCAAACPAALLASLAQADTVVLPEGTVVYAQLNEEVTSSKRKYKVGTQPAGEVWRDVQVNGVTVIAAGTPIELLITQLTPATGGRAGSIEIAAVSVRTVSGDEVTLTGGYGQQSGSAGALNSAVSTASRALGVGGYVPSGLIPGPKTVLEKGTVFDATVSADQYLDIPEQPGGPALRLGERSPLSVSVVYAELAADSDRLPFQIRACRLDWGDVTVDAVNDTAIEPILIRIEDRRAEGDCYIAKGSIAIDAIEGRLTSGANRIDVSLGDAEEEVTLNVEL